ESTDTDGKPRYMGRPPLTPGDVADIDDKHARMTRAVACLDRSIPTLLGSLGDRAQNTLVLYLSDNGFLYGEHRKRGKGLPYEESVRVPFIVRYPALLPTSSAFSSDALVENIDIAPTFADLAGISWGADGKSLLPLLTGAAPSVRDTALVSWCEGVSYPCPSNALVPESALRFPSYWEAIMEGYAYI